LKLVQKLLRADELDVAARVRTVLEEQIEGVAILTWVMVNTLKVEQARGTV
jgi:hypothetical protein